MHEYVKMTIVIVLVVMYVYGVIEVSASKHENNVTASATTEPMTVSATTTPMMIVSKEVLLEAIRQAKEEDGYLPVAIYEYNKKTDLWDRASFDCVKERAR